MSLSSSTCSVLLNGYTGPAFSHMCGLRQGDPLSLLLFIMAIDPLFHLIRVAADRGMLLPVRARAARCRMSRYADDAGIFANPTRTSSVR